MLNHIVIMGRLTRDPELRYTQSGVPVASYTVAVDRDFADQSGERPTDFIDCVAWRQTGEFVSRYFQKGSMIVTEGRLQSRKWQDRDGNNRTSWEINADRVYFGESKRNDQQGGYQQGQQQGYAQGYGQQGYTGATRNQNAYSGQQGGYRQVDQARNVYPGPEMNELDGDDPDNPFTGRDGQHSDARGTRDVQGFAGQAQQYGGQQSGMWDQLNDEADGELPF